MKLGIDRYGDGPDLALIHGWGIGAAAWDDLLPLLTPHFRVHVVALPGYPPAAAERLERSFQPPPGEDPQQSPMPAPAADPAAPADFIACAAEIAAVLPAGCTLCGWSLGAQLALAATYAAPGRFARLLLCGATPSFVQRDRWPCAQPATLLDRFDAALADDSAATLKRFIALFNQGDRRARAIGRTFSRALAARGQADDATLARGLDWLRRVDLRAQLKTIVQPTLLIHGEADPLMPLAAAHWLADALPRARLEVFTGAAHAPFASDCERFARLLVDFCDASAVD